MPDVVGDHDEVGGLHLRQPPFAPRVDLDDLAGVLNLDARVEERRDDEVAAGGRKAIGAAHGAADTEPKLCPTAQDREHNKACRLQHREP